MSTVPRQLWCARCERMKPTFLFNAGQRPKSDGSRRCMMCERAQNKDSKSRGVKAAGSKWKTHDAMFPQHSGFRDR